MTSYRSNKNTFSTHDLHIFVNEISSPTYTTLMFVLYRIYIMYFSLWFCIQPDDGHKGRNM